MLNSQVPKSIARSQSLELLLQQARMKKRVIRKGDFVIVEPDEEEASQESGVQTTG